MPSPSASRVVRVREIHTGAWELCTLGVASWKRSRSFVDRDGGVQVSVATVARQLLIHGVLWFQTAASSDRLIILPQTRNRSGPS